MRNYRIALGIGAGLMIILLIVGILQDPAAFLADAARIPQAWASLALWLAVSVLVFWLAAEALTRLLVGKGLAQMRADGDPQFEQNLVLAGLITLAILLLVAQGRVP
ncbi:MAG: hypothetical protein U0822_13235 [Anaerolineae bacterium]